MPENTPKTEQRNGATAEVVRRGAAAARGTTEALRQAPQVAAEQVRNGQAAVTEAVRATVEAAQQPAVQAAEAVGQANAEMVRRAAETAAKGPDALAQDAQRNAASLWAGGFDLWRGLPGAAPMPGGMGEMPQAFAGLFGDLLRNNLRVAQEMLRLTNPVALIELQQRMMRGYVDAVLHSQSMLLGTAQRAAETAQRPPGR
ncbi:hypothetical protein [Paracraurococcus ruber]|nr:hypothetical protein [Paracraurococcus ruber]TDG32607.1 hypothetical protein E2C05_06325 [Paracraurococcus ruber]